MGGEWIEIFLIVVVTDTKYDWDIARCKYSWYLVAFGWIQIHFTVLKYFMQVITFNQWHKPKKIRNTNNRKSFVSEVKRQRWIWFEIAWAAGFHAISHKTTGISLPRSSVHSATTTTGTKVFWWKMKHSDVELSSIPFQTVTISRRPPTCYGVCKMRERLESHFSNW